MDIGVRQRGSSGVALCQLFRMVGRPDVRDSSGVLSGWVSAQARCSEGCGHAGLVLSGGDASSQEGETGSGIRARRVKQEIGADMEAASRNQMRQAGSLVDRRALQRRSATRSRQGHSPKPTLRSLNGHLPYPAASGAPGRDAVRGPGVHIGAQRKRSATFRWNW